MKTPAQIYRGIKYRLNKWYKKVYISTYERRLIRRLKNRNFSIVCSNCVGGFIYHRLHQQFLSPTINCWMNQLDFIKFVKNIHYYIGLELIFVESDKPYPVAALDDIHVFFNHSNNESEARRDWEKRKTRINYENLYVILYDNKEGITKKDIYSLRELKCKNLMVFSYSEYPDLDYVCTMPKPVTGGLSELYFDTDKYGIRTYEKYFDFVDWLNKSWN